IRIPTMIIQPYVENAIIHGLVHRDDENGKLIIRVKTEEDSIFCTIDDNGIGREKALELRKHSKLSHKSMGKEITRSRLEIISRLKGREPELIISDLMDENGKIAGTRVEVRIPILDQT
ncbi:MAG: hypothetical protein ABIJ16_14430, partial [Bacteroidota bacterium]